MVALLDHSHGTAVHHIILDIAKLYPMAIVYPFKISQESFTFQSAGSQEAAARQFVDRWVPVLATLGD